MNDETEKAVEALGGVSEAEEVVSGDNAVTDYKAEYEKLQKQIQTERVEAGRLKKANEENEALRKELAELKARQESNAEVENLPEDLRGLPTDYMQGAAVIAKRMADKAMASHDSKMKEMEERFTAEEKRRRVEAMGSFVSKIESKFPGFLASIREGGDKKQAWNRYQRFNAPTIKAALAQGDFETISHHISQFYSTIEVEVPSGNQDGSAVPDPRSMGGGVESQRAALQPGKTYTAKEYQQILNDAQERFQRHTLTYKEYTAICEELTKAYREGRVK